MNGAYGADRSRLVGGLGSDLDLTETGKLAEWTLVVQLGELTDQILHRHVRQTRPERASAQARG